MVIRRSRVPPRLRAADRWFHPIGPHAPRTGKAASGVLAIAARVLLAASIVIAAACSRAAPEEALRARIAEMEAAAEARDAAALDDPVADDFVGPGGMDRDGLRRAWIARMKRAIRTLGWRFSADRMVKDYLLKTYIPAAGGTSCDMG